MSAIRYLLDENVDVLYHAQLLRREPTSLPDMSANCDRMTTAKLKERKGLAIAEGSKHDG
jgi:hypothetical protein